MTSLPPDRKRLRASHDVPAPLMAEQYFDAIAAHATGSPERRLVAAVLLDAVLQLAERGSRGASEAEQWVRAGDAPDVALSFFRVCEMLDLDASYLARGLLGLRVGDVDAGDLPRHIARTGGAGRIAPTRRRRRTRPAM